jgi:predicted amidohydrolase
MRVAVAQIQPRLAEKERNLELILAPLEEAVGGGAAARPNAEFYGPIVASPAFTT